MWSLIKGKIANQKHEEQLKYPITSSKSIPSLQNLHTQIVSVQNALNSHFVPTQEDALLKSTLSEVVSTIEGLHAMLKSLEKELQQARSKLQQYERMKGMVERHHDIVRELGQERQKIVNSMWNQKEEREKEWQYKWNQVNSELNEVKSSIDRNKTVQTQFNQQIQQLRGKNQELTNKLNQSKAEIAKLTTELNEMHNSVNTFGPLKNKPISIQTVSLSKVFLYRAIRSPMLAYLSIKDLLSLASTSKFFRFGVIRDIGRLTYECTKRTCENNIIKEGRRIAEYQKMYEQFPSEIVKCNAVKFLFFGVKPGGYLLPVLKEGYTEQTQKQEMKSYEEQLDKKKIEEQKKKKFSWKGIFSNNKEKEVAPSKFTISQLKNQQVFKQIQRKLESFFNNLLPFRLPQDLQTFSFNAQTQYQQLKDLLSQNSTNIHIYTSQLFHLAKFMYLQAMDLHSLTLVIWGKLIEKERQTRQWRQKGEYAEERENVLRGVVERMAKQKSELQKREWNAESERVQCRLQRDMLASSLSSLQGDYHKLQSNLLHTQQQLSNVIEQQSKSASVHQHLSSTIAKIRDELDRMPTDPRQNKRKQSFQTRKGSIDYKQNDM